MAISDRIESTIEHWSEIWRERLKGFLVEVGSFSMEVFFDIIAKGGAPKLTPLIERLESLDLPDDLKVLLQEIKEPTGEIGAILAGSAGGAATGGLISSTLGPILLKWCQYPIQKLVHQYLPPEGQIIVALWRGLITREDANEWFAKFGYTDEWISKVEELFKFLPSPEALVNWQAKEVFEPKMIEHYGLGSEFDELDLSLFEKVGVSQEQAFNFWVAHWKHPEWQSITDMYHRGLIEYEDIERWFRLVEIPPYWRDKMIGISWDLPNRIETRMMARYGLVDKQWLVDHLKRIGLHEDYRDIAADFMLAMGIRTDLSSRYGKGWITAEEVKSEIQKTGLTEQIGDRLYQWIVDNTQNERTETEKKATKSEIIKGVKKEIITRDEGLSLLQDLGYGSEEADFVLNVNDCAEGVIEIKATERDLTKADILNALKNGNIGVNETITMLEGIGYDRQESILLILYKMKWSDEDIAPLLQTAASPHSYISYKNLVESYKKSGNQRSHKPSPELMNANNDYIIAKRRLKAAKDRNAKDNEIAILEKELQPIEYRYRQLLIQYQELAKQETPDNV